MKLVIKEKREEEKAKGALQKRLEELQEETDKYFAKYCARKQSVCFLAINIIGTHQALELYKRISSKIEYKDNSKEFQNEESFGQTIRNKINI